MFTLFDKTNYLRSLLQQNDPTLLIKDLSDKIIFENIIRTRYAVNFELSTALKITSHYLLTLCLGKTLNLKYVYVLRDNNKNIIEKFQLCSDEQNDRIRKEAAQRGYTFEPIETNMKYLLRTIFILVAHGGSYSLNYYKFCDIFDSTAVFSDMSLLPNQQDPALLEFDYYLRQNSSACRLDSGFYQDKIDLLNKLKKIHQDYRNKISDYNGFQNNCSLIDIVATALDMGNLSDIEPVKHEGQIGYFYKQNFIPAKLFETEDFPGQWTLSTALAPTQSPKTLSSADFTKLLECHALTQLKEKIGLYTQANGAACQPQQKLEMRQLKMIMAIIDRAQDELGYGHAPNGSLDELIELSRPDIGATDKIKKYVRQAYCQIRALRRLPQVSRIERKHHSIQFIALCADMRYQVRQANEENPLGEAGSLARHRRYGGDYNDQVDIQNKIARLIAAIKLTAKHPEFCDDPEVLKVFVAPEGFFRGSKGAYSISAIGEILTGLRAFTGKPEYRDWLFMPGTAIAALWRPADPESFSKSVPLSAQQELINRMELFNVALVQHGGYWRADGRHEALVYKEFVSSLDLLSTAATDETFSRAPTAAVPNQHFHKALINNVPHEIWATQGSRDYGGANKPSRSIIEKGALALGGNWAGGCVLTDLVEGIPFGVEICLDHSAGGRLRRRVRRAENGSMRGLVDVQIIISAGASIQLDKVAVRPGGLVFNVDGFRVDGLSGRPAQEVRRLAAELKIAVVDANGTATDLQHIPPAYLQRSSKGDTVAIFPVQSLPKRLPRAALEGDDA